MRGLTFGKTLANRAAKQQGALALEMINDKIYTVKLEKKYVLPVRQKNNFAEPINQMND